MIRLTKKRLARLHDALSLDDVLYEKFKREHEWLQREAERIYRRRKILAVYQERGDGVRMRLQVVDVQMLPEGSIVTVR